MPHAGQPHELQTFLGLLPCFRLAQSGGLQAISDIVERRHMREKRVGLENHRDIALIGRQHGHILVADQNATGRRMFEPRQHAQRRRFAATGGTEKCHQRAGFDGERKVGDGGEGAECLADILKGDGAGLYGNHAVFS